MAKSLFIAEKPSVAREFARVLGMATSSKKGYIESDKYVVTWCVGHLVTMSYPESYDMKYKKWRLDTLPFIPDTFKYEIIPSAKNQYDIVSKLLNRDDVDVIYICTDSGREGEYIYRLVDQMAQVENKIRKRVWTLLLTALLVAVSCTKEEEIHLEGDTSGNILEPKKITLWGLILPESLLLNMEIL